MSLLGPNLPHSGFGLNATEPQEEIILQIRQEQLEQSIKSLPELKSIEALIERSGYGLCFGEKIKKEVKSKMIALVNYSPSQKYISLLEILFMMSETTDYSILNKQLFDSSSIHKHKARLQKIFTYVEQHYQEEIDLRRVSSLVQLSIPSFCNYFKKATMITFTDFINSYRIQKATLLILQDKTISEAAFECGFNNVTYFNKVFKQTINLTPPEFRRKNNI